MKIAAVHIRNFRTIHDEAFSLDSYSLIIGANNSGKSNVIDALRVMYDSLKFDPGRDLPKGLPEQEESWLEVEYRLEGDEVHQIKTEWVFEQDRFRVRKYLYPVKKEKEGIYGFLNGK